jgi:hypothetical protein
MWLSRIKVAIQKVSDLIIKVTLSGAWAFGLACVFTIFLWISNKRPNDHVFNGITMLGLAITILRLLSQENRRF